MALQDRDALVAFWEATDGEYWRDSTNWNTDGNISTWLGVTVNGEGRVVQLHLASNNLRGPIPAALGALSELKDLKLDDNQLTGPIPTELGELVALERLVLRVNGLSGHIPPQLGNLSALELLDLTLNELAGPIPPELAKLGALKRLVLRENSLSGTIPPQLKNLGALELLDLTFNELDGPIPPELGQLTALEALVLRQNKLTGFIPPQLGNLSALKMLDLSFNELTGTISPELGKLGALERLLLWDNKLGGSIPPDLAKLAALKYLYLQDNQLSGSIPPELGSLAALKYFSVEFNRLSGRIPPQLGNLGSLEVLDLSVNGFTGTIPKELRALRRLTYLNLSINRLSGHIPEELGALTELKQLELLRNQLTGPIPPELGKLRALEQLMLWENKLRGPIPKELGKLTALKLLHLNNNKLQGLLPPELGNLVALQEVQLSNNQLNGPLPPALLKHPRFEDFENGLSVDGAHLPEVRDRTHAIKILIVPVVLGYADLATDLFIAASYYKIYYFVWFLGLVFALGPSIILAGFFQSSIRRARRCLVAIQLSLLVEAFKTVRDGVYSPVLALVRVVGPLFESMPQLLLQLYAILRHLSEAPSSSSSSTSTDSAWRVASVCISAASLAYGATDASSVGKLIECCGDRHGGGCGGDSGRFGLYPRFLSLTGLVFSRVPEEGLSALRGLGDVHPRVHIWLCFAYHTLEIVSRFLPLALLLLVMRVWFLFVLPYLWLSRGVVVLAAAWITEELSELQGALKTLDVRFGLRMIAMPFLDSAMDGTVAFGVALVLTLAEFVVCMVSYRAFDDGLPYHVRRDVAAAASVCLFGKMCLAWVAMSPLKASKLGPKAARLGPGGRYFTNEPGNAAKDGSLAGLDMVGMEEGLIKGEVEATAAIHVHDGVAPPEGMHLPTPAKVLLAPTKEQEAKVEDEVDGAAQDGSVAGSQIARMEAGKAGGEGGVPAAAVISLGVVPSEKVHLESAVQVAPTTSLTRGTGDAEAADKPGGPVATGPKDLLGTADKRDDLVEGGVEAAAAVVHDLAPQEGVKLSPATNVSPGSPAGREDANNAAGESDGAVKDESLPGFDIAGELKNREAKGEAEATAAVVSEVVIPSERAHRDSAKLVVSTTASGGRGPGGVVKLEDAAKPNDAAVANDVIDGNAFSDGSEEGYETAEAGNGEVVGEVLKLTTALSTGAPPGQTNLESAMPMSSTISLERGGSQDTSKKAKGKAGAAETGGCVESSETAEKDDDGKVEGEVFSLTAASEIVSPGRTRLKHATQIVSRNAVDCSPEDDATKVGNEANGTITDRPVARLEIAEAEGGEVVGEGAEVTNAVSDIVVVHQGEKQRKLATQSVAMSSVESGSGSFAGLEIAGVEGGEIEGEGAEVASAVADVAVVHQGETQRELPTQSATTSPVGDVRAEDELEPASPVALGSGEGSDTIGVGEDGEKVKGGQGQCCVS